MTLLCDSREKKNEHLIKYFKKKGIPFQENVALKVGDYMFEGSNVVIDRKAGLDELYNNVVHTHDRFKRECLRAVELGLKLIVLIEEENIADISEVHKWKNPRISKWYMIKAAQQKGKMLHIKLPKQPPRTSANIQKTLETMEQKYGVKFLFAKKKDFPARVIEILTKQSGDENDGNT